MATMFSKQRHQAKLPRHPHDLSHHVSFTSPIGMLLPVMFDYLDPGEKIVVNDMVKTVAQPMEANNFMRVTEHVEYFFVPMEQLYSAFGSWYYKIFDVHSNFYSGEVIDVSSLNPPTIDPVLFFWNMSKSFSGVKDNASGSLSSLYYDMASVSRLLSSARLIDMMQLGHYPLSFSYTAQTPVTSSSYVICPWLFAAYQKIWNDVYRLDDFITPSPCNFNMDGIGPSYSTVFPTSYTTSLASQYPQVGLFEMRYRPWKKDVFTNIYPNPYYSSGDSSTGLGSSSSWARLNSFAGISGSIPKNSGSSTSISQNRVFNNGQNNLASEVAYQSSNSQMTEGSNTEGPYFLPSATFYASPAIPSSYLGDETNLSVNTLAALYAQDKISKITGSAAKHYDAQVLAHFGYSVPRGIGNEVYRLGGHDSYLQTSAIYATATTDTSGDGSGSVLGEQGGRMSGASGKNAPISFTAPCHGVLMALYSMDCEADYSTFFVNPLHQMQYSDDFYKPEYDSLGMIPQYVSNYNMPDKSSSLPSGIGSLFSLVRGWTYRYWFMKSKPDVVSGALNYTLRTWTPTKNEFDYGSASYTGAQLNQMSSFYINPCYTDNVFVLGFQRWIDFTIGTSDNFPWSSLYERDPFIHFIDFTYKKVSVKSTYGVPNL